jgi:hypothetical protein
MMTITEYMRWKGLSDAKMGRLVGVSAVSILRYRHGRVPEWPIMVRIHVATKGMVSPNSWLPIGRLKKMAA